ncbi:uncharacterized protein LOC143031691 [Oratosquilla oratoria]|uniref:uncharacterized protein LOC143031691 n=1 Tax=Oratosquilla oratoria TaxID=337810 RepID=UPI003F772D1F
MEDDCVIVEDKDLHSGPPLKKLKQGRLPFTLFNSKTPTSSCLPLVQQKKRKHSGNEAANKSLKNARQEKAPTPKQDTAKEELGYHKATDDEISSSCDENVPDALKDNKAAVSNVNRKTPTLLQKFIKYERTRQDEVSTSVGDDVEDGVGGKTVKQKSGDADEGEDGKRDRDSADSDSGSTKREKCAEVTKSGDCVIGRKSSQGVTKLGGDIDDQIEESNEVDSTNIGEDMQDVAPCRNEKSERSQKEGDKDEVCTSQSSTKADTPSHSQRKEEGSALSKSISANRAPEDGAKVTEKLKTEAKNQSEPETSQSDEMTSGRDVNSSPKNEDGIEKANGSPGGTPVSSKSPRAALVPKKLTPKQQMREADKQKKREEREKLRKKKEEEKLEEKKKKEAERNERERVKKEREEEKMRQKEEKQKKKQEEQEMKVKEKQKKEEVKRQAEEEEKRKKNRLSEKFTSFFVKKPDAAPVEEIKTQGPFMQFRVKENMRIAPRVRSKLSEEQYTILDSVLEGTYSKKDTYINLLRIKQHAPKGSGRTWPNEEKRDDDYCEVIDDEDMDEGEEDMIVEEVENENKPSSNVKAKLLQFCENQRPAYWGTWRKKTTKVNARKPFNKDEDLFDYEYDSDDDWEEEEAGESLSDSEGEDKEEEEVDNQYEVDNDFFVPHGYLSDDEGKDEDSEGEDEKNKDKDEIREKERLKVKQAEFEEEMKKKTKQKKPRVFGCLWVDDKVNPAYEQLLKILNPYRVGMCVDNSTPIRTSFSRELPKDIKESKPEDVVDDRQTTVRKFVKKFPEEAIKPLIQLIHGNRHGKQFLIREFGMYWKKVNGGEISENEKSPEAANTPKTLAGGAGYISKKKIEMKINEVGEWIRCPEGHGKGMMWFVTPEVRARYSAEDVVLPNTWSYNLKPKEHKERQPETSGPETPEVAKPSANLITRFTKVMTEEELKKSVSVAQEPRPSQESPQQTSEKPSSGSPNSLQTSTDSEATPSSNTPVLKKKVPLISVPRVHDNPSVQTPSIKNFFKKDSGQTKSLSPKGLFRTSPNSAKVSTKGEDDIECITLD